MNRRRMFILVAFTVTVALLCAPAWSQFPASTKGGGVCNGFPDVCKTPLDSVEALPVNKAPSEAQIVAVERGLDEIMASVAFADQFLPKSKEPKAKIEEAWRVLAQVRQLVAQARKHILSVPRGDRTGALRARLKPILQELYTIPYPTLLRPAAK